MEAGTVAPAAASTGSKTIADLMALAAERHGAREAQRYKRDGEWHSVSFEELGRTVSEIAPRSDRPRHPARRARLPPVRDAARVDLLRLRDLQRRRRRRADLPDQLAERVRVGGRQLRVGRDRLRGRPAAGEDRRGAGEPARPRARDRHRPVRRRETATRSRSTTCASAAAAATRRSCKPRREAVAPEDTYTIIYTSGTTGPPKGCVLSHRNYRQVVNMCEELGRRRGGRRRLPLPPARARLRAADPAAGDRPRLLDRLLLRRPEADRARADGGPPDLPAVGAADLREDLHARHLQRRPRADQGRRRRRA